MENQSGWKGWRIPVSMLVALWLQTSLGQLVPVRIAEWVGHIDWLLLLTVYVGLRRDFLQTLATAVIAGVLIDSSSYGGVIGVAGLGYLLVAYLLYWITIWIAVDNLRVRLGSVALASLLSMTVRLLFYRLLDVDLPVLAEGGGVAATLLFGMLMNLCASVAFYILLDRIFLWVDPLQRRRSAALRRRR